MGENTCCGPRGPAIGPRGDPAGVDALCAADAPDDGSANGEGNPGDGARTRPAHAPGARGDIALTVSLTPQAFHALAVSVGMRWRDPPEAVHMRPGRD